jgi:hypothetical protein
VNITDSIVIAYGVLLYLKKVLALVVKKGTDISEQTLVVGVVTGL